MIWQAFIRVLICILLGLVPVRLSGLVADIFLCVLRSLHKPSVSAVQHPAQHRHRRSALWLLLRSSEGESKDAV